MQKEINLNVQERLRALEATQQIMSAFLFAAVETHPDPAALKQRFDQYSERLIGQWIGKPLPEDWISTAIGYRDALLQAFDRTTPEED